MYYDPSNPANFGPDVSIAYGGLPQPVQPATPSMPIPAAAPMTPAAPAAPATPTATTGLLNAAMQPAAPAIPAAPAAPAAQAAAQAAAQTAAAKQHPGRDNQARASGRYPSQTPATAPVVDAKASGFERILQRAGLSMPQGWTPDTSKHVTRNLETYARILAELNRNGGAVNWQQPERGRLGMAASMLFNPSLPWMQDNAALPAIGERPRIENFKGTSASYGPPKNAAEATSLRGYDVAAFEKAVADWNQQAWNRLQAYRAANPTVNWQQQLLDTYFTQMKDRPGMQERGVPGRPSGPGLLQQQMTGGF